MGNKIQYAIFFLLASTFAFSQTRQNNNGAENSENQQLSGHDGFLWGSSYETVRERLKTLAESGETDPPLDIIYDDPQKEIRISRGGVVYRYVFYAEPEELAQRRNEKMAKAQNPPPPVEAAPPEPETAKDTAEEQALDPELPADTDAYSDEAIFAAFEEDMAQAGQNGQETTVKPPVADPVDAKENQGVQNNQNMGGSKTKKSESTMQAQARFFFLESTFPYLPAEELYQKISAKYGSRTGNTVNKEKRGAYIWELDNGYLIQWVDPFEQGMYTRSIYYLSQDMAAQIGKDYQEFMYLRELNTIEKILP